MKSDYKFYNVQADPFSLFSPVFHVFKFTYRVDAESFSCVALHMVFPRSSRDFRHLPSLWALAQYRPLRTPHTVLCPDNSRSARTARPATAQARAEATHRTVLCPHTSRSASTVRPTAQARAESLSSHSSHAHVIIALRSSAEGQKASKLT